MYEDLEKVCEENWFGSEFMLWDIIEYYVTNGIDLKKLPEHLKIVCDEYVKILKESSKGVEQGNERA